MSDTKMYTETQIKNIVTECVKKIMNEGWFSKKSQMPEKPQSVNDVFKGNGWYYTVVDKVPGDFVVRCYVSNSSSLRTALPFEELVEDVNIYYEDKGLPIKAEGMEEYNGTEGAFMRVRKLQ